MAIVLSASVRDPGPTAGVLLFGVVISLGFLRSTRVRVVLDDRGVTVYRLVTTEFVPWSDLAAVNVDYGGLRLLRSDGGTVTAASMGKPNWATWLNRRVAPDDWVDVIRGEMSKGQQPGT